MKSICRLMPVELRNVQLSGSCSKLAKQRPNIWENSRIMSPRSPTFHCVLKSPPITTAYFFFCASAKIQ